MTQGRRRPTKSFPDNFRIPRIEYEVTSSNMDLGLEERIIYTRVHGDNFDLLPLFLSEFARSLDGDDPYRNAFNSILHTDDRAENALRDTVLLSRRWYYYCEMLRAHYINYSISQQINRESSIGLGMHYLSSKA